MPASAWKKLLGLLLVIASLILIGLVFAARKLAWIISALLGWAGIVAARFNGASFLNYGHAISSLARSSVEASGARGMSLWPPAPAACASSAFEGAAEEDLAEHVRCFFGCDYQQRLLVIIVRLPC